jgi:hypothetical protein
MKSPAEHSPASSVINPANVIAQDADDLPSQRQQLAQMIGRLLARHWLRRQAHDSKQTEASNSNLDR